MFRRRPSEDGAHRHAVIEVVDDINFDVLAAGGAMVVDLWAPWCGPCLRFRPMFEVVAATWQHTVRFGACNVDDNPETAMRLGVRSIPTVVALGPDGRKVGRLVGVPSKARLETLVSDVAGLQ